MAENNNPQNQGQGGNNPESGKQQNAQTNDRNSSQQGGQGFKGEQGNNPSSSSQTGGQGQTTGTGTQRAEDKTGDPGRTPGKAEGEDNT